MVALDVGANKEKEHFVKKATQSHLLLADLEHQILQTENYISHIEQNAQSQRDKITEIFQEVRQKLLEREQTLK